MASTVSKTTFTSKITETISINKHHQQLETTLSIPNVTDYSHRIMSVATGTSSIILLGPSDNAGTFDKEKFKYLRITNLDDTNFITLKLSRGADAQCYFVKVKPGESYVLMCPEIAAAVEEGASPALGNIGKISAKPDTASVYVEYLVVTKGGTATGEGGE